MWREAPGRCQRDAGARPHCGGQRGTARGLALAGEAATRRAASVRRRPGGGVLGAHGGALLRGVRRAPDPCPNRIPNAGSSSSGVGWRAPSARTGLCCPLAAAVPFPASRRPGRPARARILRGLTVLGLLPTRRRGFSRARPPCPQAEKQPGARARWVVPVGGGQGLQGTSLASLCGVSPGARPAAPRTSFCGR